MYLSMNGDSVLETLKQRISTATPDAELSEKLFEVSIYLSSSIYLSIFIYLSIYIFIYLSTYLSIPIYLCIYLSISVYLSMNGDSVLETLKQRISTATPDAELSEKLFEVLSHSRPHTSRGKSPAAAWEPRCQQRVLSTSAGP